MLSSSDNEWADDISIYPETDEGNYGAVVIEPLERGYGVTLGNPLRRILYNGIEGSAMTAVRINGVTHEHEPIPHVREVVRDILINLKAVRIRWSGRGSSEDVLQLKAVGPGQVSAADIMSHNNLTVVNPEQHICTLDSPAARFDMRMWVERGTGYQEMPRMGADPGILPIDAIFAPVRKVTFQVQRARAGGRTDMERLVLEVWTDGTTDALDAVNRAAGMLMARFGLLASRERWGRPGRAAILPELYEYNIGALPGIPTRARNSLEAAGITSIGKALEMNREELLQVRGFGESAYADLYKSMREAGLLPAELDPDIGPEED